MLATIVFLLAAAVVFVSISRRLGLGSILGYLVSGMIIGPAGLGLVTDVGEIAEIAELGVLMLLFLIGLELRLQRLWLMRRAVFGLGAAQLFVTGAVVAVALAALGQPWGAAAVLGVGLALSSTAIALPMLSERELLNGASGRDSFAVLLFQDVASVPLVAAIPLIGHPMAASGPVWPLVLKAIAAVAGIVLVGRYALRPIFRLIGEMKSQEVFTAAALLTVVSAAAVAHAAGLPTSLGAFAAGVILSDSEYRHELEADIQPFEGLLLGFFFISVGMGADLSLLRTEPLLILAGAAAMIAAKIAVVVALQRFRGVKPGSALRTAASLAQGSEFGFVLFGVALAAGVLAKAEFDRANLVVALSMAASPILFALSERYVIPRLMQATPRKHDEIKDARPRPVIICGFGRFGQIVGRVLNVRRIPFHALDDDAGNIDAVRRFGHTAYFGDPSRLELLRAVGAADARILVVAVGDVELSMKIVNAARAEFPHLTILARARNRRHAHLLMDAGVTQIVRETFFSSLRLTELALIESGLTAPDARETIRTFREHDERSLVAQHDFYKDEKQLVQTATQSAAELQRLFEDDASPSGGTSLTKAAEPAQ